MARSRPNAHYIIGNIMKQRGYAANEAGVCCAIIFMWHQYAQDNKESELFDQIELMCQPDFPQRLAEVMDLVRRGAVLTEEQKLISGANSLLEGIELYFHAMEKREFIGRVRGPFEIETVAKYTASKSLEKQGGLKNIHIETRFPLRSEIKKYMADLRDFHLNLARNRARYGEEKTEKPVLTFSMANDRHEMGFRYDDIKDKWVLIDSNELQYRDRIYSTDDIVDRMMDLFHEKDAGALPFNLTMYTSRLASTSHALSEALRDFRRIQVPYSEEVLRVNERGRSLLWLAAAAPDPETFAYMARQPGANLSLADSSGDTIAHRLAITGQVELLKILHVKGIDLNARNAGGKTPFDCAVAHGQIETMDFLRTQCGVVITDTPALRAAIFTAVEAGHADVLNYFHRHLNTTLDITRLMHSKTGLTPLQTATAKGQLDIVKFFVEECKADTSSILYQSIGDGSVNITGHLLASGVAIDVSDPRLITALFAAAKAGHVDMLRYIRPHVPSLDLTKIVNTKDFSLLELSAAKGQLGVIRFLLEECKPTLDEIDFNAVLCQAVSGGHVDVTNYLLSMGVTFDPTHPHLIDALFVAAKAGRVELFEYLKPIFEYLKLNVPGFDITTLRNSDGLTLFQAASLEGQLPFVKLLVNEYKLDVNEGSEMPLHFILSRVTDKFSSNHLKVIQFLVEDCKADVNHRDTSGATPVLWATKGNNMAALQYFSTCPGCDFYQADNFGITPLHKAASMGQVALVKSLVDANPDGVNQSDRMGNTVVHYAVKARQLDVLKLLITYRQIDFSKLGSSFVKFVAATNDPAIIGFFATPHTPTLFKGVATTTARDASSSPAVLVAPARKQQTGY